MTAHKAQPSPNGNCATGRKLGSLGQSLIVLKSFSPAIVAESPALDADILAGARNMGSVCGRGAYLVNSHLFIRSPHRRGNSIGSGRREISPPMGAGAKKELPRGRTFSGRPPKAGIGWNDRRVRLAPTADSCTAANRAVI